MPLQAVGSTNAEALSMANAGDPGKLWVIANEQTAGRARRGRSWVSQPGNLYASLLLVDPAPATALATLPLVVSLAVHRAIARALPDAADALQIKWPNDLLLNGKKLSGTLLESQPDRHGRLAVVIGCGVNCRHFPDNPLYPATSLEREGFGLAPQALFGHLVQSMADSLDQWDEGRGFAAIRRGWLSRAASLGGVITARFPDHEVKGRFIELDHHGLLVLELPNGERQSISSADIFFGVHDRTGA